MERLRALREGLWLLDTDQFGVPGYGGVYILRDGPEAALVETGTSLAVPRVLGALDALGIRREAVRWLFLTHIHLDHGGGAGALVRELPAAVVVVHGRGAKHLADPSRLLSSVREAVGERFPQYGTLDPIPPERIEPVADERAFRVGSLEVKAVPTPGHAPHHLCFFLPGTGELFTGDAAGLYLGGRLCPATPPPSFDLEASLESLERLRGLGPRTLLFTHFGPGAPGLLAEYGELLRRWVERIRRAWVPGDEGATLARLLSDPGMEAFACPGELGREELVMNIRGVMRYLARQQG